MLPCLSADTLVPLLCLPLCTVEFNMYVSNSVDNTNSNAPISTITTQESNVRLAGGAGGDVKAIVSCAMHGAATMQVGGARSYEAGNKAGCHARTPAAVVTRFLADQVLPLS